MRAIGRDEVDDRSFVLEVSGEVNPAVVGLEDDVLVGRLVEGAPGLVKRGDASVSSASEVDGRQVKRQTEQVVAQRGRHELVDLVTDLPGHAADDGAGGYVIRDRVSNLGTVSVIRERIEEALDQPDMVRRQSPRRSGRWIRSASSGRSDRRRGRTQQRSTDRSWCRSHRAPGRR